MQIPTCRTRLHAWNNSNTRGLAFANTGTSTVLPPASTSRRFDCAKTRLQPCRLYFLSRSLLLPTGTIS